MATTRFAWTTPLVALFQGNCSHISGPEWLRSFSWKKGRRNSELMLTLFFLLLGSSNRGLVWSWYDCGLSWPGLFCNLLLCSEITTSSWWMSQKHLSQISLLDSLERVPPRYPDGSFVQPTQYLSFAQFVMCILFFQIYRGVTSLVSQGWLASCSLEPSPSFSSQLLENRVSPGHSHSFQTSGLVLFIH